LIKVALGQNMAILAPVQRRAWFVNPRWMVVLVVATVTLHTAFYRPQTFMHLIQWYETNPPLLLGECPQSLLFLDDTGRMGNRFFEFLAAKMFAEQLNRSLYINQQFSDFLSNYFNGLHTPVYGMYNSLKSKCGLVDANITSVNMNHISNINQSYANVSYVKLTSNH
jgi:hypothetical protein